MNGLDAVIIILLLADMVRGVRIGFSRQFFSFAGFWGGLFLAALLAPLITRYSTSILTKILLVLFIALAIAAVLSAIGEIIGIKLSHLIQRTPARLLDEGLGGLFGAVLVLLSTWILSAMLHNVSEQGIAQAIQGSRIISVLDANLPPAPPFIAKIQRIIDPNGFPQVFLGPEPAPGGSVTVASPEEVNAAIRATQASVVKIEGVGCGGEVFGSGFVAASGEVVTNAHVIAGIKRPLVLDRNGVHTATPIYFDPGLDLAVLRVNGTLGPALPLATGIAAGGTHSVALGFPGGGSFTASPAGIIQNYIATGRNIYDAGITTRRVYEIQAVVQPGNSGGPLVLPDGTVVGVLFARSEINENVGYALTMPAVSSGLAKAHNHAPVSTSVCAAD